MPPTRRFRFEVVTERADGWRMLVSRHHERPSALRRVARYPLQPGQSVSVIEDGKVVAFARCPGPNDLPEIPF
ncbi:hypothetical protein [Bosea sp. (in: a-proteobacteria)]|uniref:hypothetical protein n=1 Tax=Bosea sp. (in: a-proteobacteria) TaxID=1871050 RepID=UPI001ACB2264|nr:hypothetical protein [Bosea sp. (in: a-proteobacteria)]MBN9443705.1 hypothetical protein [Bosea sp. (in: a-proteobacteria)]